MQHCEPDRHIRFDITGHPKDIMALASTMSVSSSDFSNSMAKPSTNIPSSTLPKRPQAETSSGSGDTLMEALKLTLQRMGIDPSGFATTTGSSTDTGSFSDNAGTTGSQARGDANKSAGQQFLVALYQALVLQHALTPPAQQDAGTASTDPVTSAYVDLGSSIGELAQTVRSTAAERNSSADTWGWQLDAPLSSTSGNDQGSTDSSAIAGAVNTLDNALQSYVAPDGNGSEVSLADVLDGLGKETRGIRWTPIGLVVDIKI